MNQNNNIPSKITGKVIIAGAGPGDPELVTVKVAKYLQQADVVLTDRLVSEQILSTYVQPGADIIHVGKQCRRGVSTPQKTINELMVHHAMQGKFVVRLKGGDVSVFSNILDELEALVANNIGYEIIPGITAALGAAAYAGIPLTAREHSTAVRFLTYYKSDILNDAYWKELADTNDTLVFYMSTETLDTVVAKLLANKIAPGKLMAVIEQATTPFQKVHITDLYGYKEKLKQQTFLSPSIVIIGRVVAFHQQFAWLQNCHTDEYFFKPITSQIITIHNSEKPTKHVTRA